MAHHQPQTIVVVIIVWIVLIAVRRGGIVLFIVERATPQHLPGSLTNQDYQPPLATSLYAELIPSGCPKRAKSTPRERRGGKARR